MASPHWSQTHKHQEQNNLQVNATRAAVGTHKGGVAKEGKEATPGDRQPALTKVAWAPVTTQGSEAEPNAKTASTQWPEEPGQVTCLSGGWVSNPNSEGHKENFQLLPASRHLPHFSGAAVASPEDPSTGRT